jgi:hypothetical protein
MLPQGFTKSKGYAQGGWRDLKLCEENVKDLYQSFTKNEGVKRGGEGH